MTRPTEQTGTWELVALIATMVIVVSLPVYYFTVVKDSYKPVSQIVDPEFVGSAECQDCHKPEFEKWLGSHHDLAMDLANEKTVLGDFNDAEFTLHGITSRFYKKDNQFLVYTNGPGGEMGEHRITHTFGWFPLQQYLVPFPGGRLQVLPIAWDSQKNQWFRVPPEEPTDPGDWLYWTNAAQNWNGMCAQCHSTNLKKNFDPETDSYTTTWSDIDVGCEACHGAGSRHVEWAQIPDMARPAVVNFDLTQKTSGIDSRELVELCAPCHSRRGTLADDTHAKSDLLDKYLPSLLTENLYFADGQIQDEVYVYGSFTQSKMYRHDVRCNDCHEVHSIKLVKEGNDLCLQCHRAAIYNTGQHHFHKKAGEKGEPIKSADGETLFEVGSGALCVQCHMPGRNYMGIDYRPDHSFRIPNPTLSASIGSTDACLRCHIGKDPQWSQDSMLKWYGPGRSDHYGSILAMARNADPEAGKDLLRLSIDPLYPVVVRATALSMLAAYPGPDSTQTLQIALLDEEPLMRRTALDTINIADRRKLVELIVPSLYDPIKAVRIGAADRLAGELETFLDKEQQELFMVVLQEYITTMNYSADFASARHNLGNLYTNRGEPDKAIEQYQEAIRIDDQFYPAKVNLAVLYSQQNQLRQAEKLLKEVVNQEPELYDAAYSLGLLLIEMQNMQEGTFYLEKAAEGLPERARIHYNLGLLYALQKNMGNAENALRTALNLEPGNLDFQYGLADFYLKTGKFEQARPIAEEMIATHPENPVGTQMLNFIRQNTGR